MNQPLTHTVLSAENEIFTGRGGVSRENRCRGFIPAFYDTHSCQAIVSRFANGAPAPLHVLEGLPEEWVVARDKSGRVAAVKDFVIAGFIQHGRFYTREQAAQAVSHYWVTRAQESEEREGNGVSDNESRF